MIRRRFSSIIIKDQTRISPTLMLINLLLNQRLIRIAKEWLIVEGIHL
jgi:hypothetical protein